MEQNPKRPGRPTGAKIAPDTGERLRRAVRKALKTGDWSRVRLLSIEVLIGKACREETTKGQVEAWRMFWEMVDEREAKDARTLSGVKDKPRVAESLFKPLGRKSVEEEVEEKWAEEARLKRDQDTGKPTP